MKKKGNVTNIVTFCLVNRLILWKAHIGPEVIGTVALGILIGLSLLAGRPTPEAGKSAEWSNMSYSDIKSYVELKTGYNDNLNLGNSTNKEGGRVTEAYFNLESPAGPGSVKYNFGWIQNPALTIFDTGYSLPEGQSTRNHLVTYKFKEDIPAILSFELKGQGEYNDADLKELTYKKYLISGHIDRALSDKNTTGVEATYSRRLYDEVPTGQGASPASGMATRSDTTKVVSANSSYVGPMQVTGYVEYEYITNESDHNYYTFRGYGPMALLTVPLTSQNDTSSVNLQLLCSQETRNYGTGFTDKTVTISPGIVNKQLKFIRILLEYSFVKNTSSDANRRFIQNKYTAGLSISF